MSICPVEAFGPEADRIYQAAHAALIARDKPALHKLVTETAFMVRAFLSFRDSLAMI